MSLRAKSILPQLPSTAKLISHLSSSLKHSFLTCLPWNEAGEYLKDVISCLVLQCRPLLRSFSCGPPLSEGALLHLTQLPNLRSLDVFHEPPRTSRHPLSHPSKCCLNRAAMPWLHLLVARVEGRHRSGLAPSPAIIKHEPLKVLAFPAGTCIDSVLTSSISSFQNLVSILVTNRSCPRYDCRFYLTDDDVEDFAIRLPSLTSLRLGEACSSFGCGTTVSSLLSLSTHCLELTYSEIHFNTLDIVEDVKHLLIRGKPRCRLRGLSVGRLSLGVYDHEYETLAMGSVDIFPCLEFFPSCPIGRVWERVEAELENRLTYGYITTAYPIDLLHRTTHWSLLCALVCTPFDSVLGLEQVLSESIWVLTRAVAPGCGAAITGSTRQNTTTFHIPLLPLVHVKSDL